MQIKNFDCIQLGLNMAALSAFKSALEPSHLLCVQVCTKIELLWNADLDSLFWYALREGPSVT